MFTLFQNIHLASRPKPQSFPLVKRAFGFSDHFQKITDIINFHTFCLKLALESAGIAFFRKGVVIWIVMEPGTARVYFLCCVHVKFRDI